MISESHIGILIEILLESMETGFKQHSTTDISPEFSIGNSWSMASQDNQKPPQNVAQMLHDMWKRAGHPTQDAFAIACGYVGQHSMGDYFNRRKYEGRYFSTRLVNKFRKGLVENAPRPLLESEVWELVAPDHRPRVLESADSSVTFRKAFEVARRQFAVIANAGLIPLNDAQITILATQLANELVEETDEDDSNARLRGAINTARRLGEPEE